MGDSLRIATTEREIIAEQARKVRALYPELFAALDERDRRIQRALYRIPQPGDPETMVPPQVFEQALHTLWQLNAGINRFCDGGC